MVVALLLLVLAVAGGALLCTWLRIVHHSTLPPRPLTLKPSDLGLAAEDIRVQTRDHLTIAGWFLRRPEPQRPVIIVCHGVNATRSDLLGLAGTLYAGGYHVLLFDFRAYGESGGRITSFGWHEQEDLKAALQWLSSQPALAEVPWGIYGLSMGGAVAIEVATQTPAIRAVVVDSIYSDLSRAMLVHVQLLYHVPAQWLWPWLAMNYRLRYGVWPARISPVSAAKRLGNTPLFVIHGAHDPWVPVEEAERVAAAASGPHVTWVIPGALHEGGYLIDRTAYHARILAFFQQHLDSRTQR